MLTQSQIKGQKFEEDLAQEFGLEQVPASGSVWYSKLDLKGNKARWSLKATDNLRFPIAFKDIEEAEEACYGPGGDGLTPIWAARIQNQDYILMRKEDWISFHVDDLKLINTDRPQVKARKDRASKPELLREE